MLDRRRACHAGSRAHVDQCAAEIGGIECGGIHQGQECDSRGEALFEARAKLRWAAEFRSRLKKDRKSTRLNSSHQIISYASFSLQHNTPTSSTPPPYTATTTL